MKWFEEFLKISVYPIFIYLNINTELVGILCALMLIDSILGAVKAYRIFHRFTFKILLWGIVLKMLMLLIPITVALMGRGIGYDLVILVDMTIKLMVVGEGYSILGNMYSIRTKRELKKVDAVSMMLISFRKSTYAVLTSFLQKIESFSDCNFKDRNEGDDLKQL